MKVKVLVFSGYGLNCEEETKFAFESCGAVATIAHINDIILGKVSLDKYNILALPGGFSYGDDTGSGNAFAQKIKNHLFEKIEEFIKKDSLIIGICNGFQILTNLGLLPGALLPNDNARYTVRWVDLKVESDTPWLAGIDRLSLPIAHGEGKFFAPDKTLKGLNKKGQVGLRYIENPNGSLEDIAGVTDASKKIFGMMPHPERGMFFTQLPNWTLLKEEYKRFGKELPEAGPGLKIFQNAIDYFK